MTDSSQPEHKPPHNEPRYEYPARATPRTGLRASDNDREAIAEHLRHAAAEGRLRVEELEQRLAAAWSAMTYGELDVTVSDLPRPRPASRSIALGRVRRRPARALAAAAAAAALLLAGAAGAVGLRHDVGIAASARPRIVRCATRGRALLPAQNAAPACATRAGSRCTRRRACEPRTAP
jgi:hypothetical protein